VRFSDHCILVVLLGYQISFTMAPKGTKRAQPKAAVPHAKKAKVEAKVDPMLEAVQKAIEGADFLPESCRAMLVAGLTSSLGVCSDERHATQALFVDHIAELLEQSKTKKEDALNAHEETVENFVSSKSTLDAKVVDAEAAWSAMKEFSADKMRLLQVAKEAVATAKATLAEKQEAQRVGDAADGEFKVQNESLSNAISSTLAAILRGEQPETPLAYYHALKPVMPLLSLEDTLLTALPTACGKKIEERGAFDNMAIEALKFKMQEKSEEIAKKVQDAAPAAEARAVAMTDAENVLSGATEQQAKATQELQSATAAQSQADADLKAAQAEVELYEPQCEEAKAERDEKAATLKQFVEYDISCFEMLKDKKAKQTEPALEPTQEPVASALEAMAVEETVVTAETIVDEKTQTTETAPIETKVAESVAENAAPVTVGGA